MRSGLAAEPGADDVVEADGAGRQVEVEQEREAGEALEQGLRVEVVEAGGVGPEQLDRADRDRDVLGEDGELGEAGALVGGEEVEAEADGLGDGIGAGLGIAGVEGGEAALVEQPARIGDGVGERGLGADGAVAQGAVDEAQEERPFAEAGGECGKRGVLAGGEVAAEQGHGFPALHGVDLRLLRVRRQRVAVAGGDEAGAVGAAAEEGAGVGGLPEVVEDEEDAAVGQIARRAGRRPPPRC